MLLGKFGQVFINFEHVAIIRDMRPTASAGFQVVMDDGSTVDVTNPTDVESLEAWLSSCLDWPLPPG